MNRSPKARIAALAASILMTFATVQLIAGYALPEPASTLAAARVLRA
ncbi:MAG: hypothetical protein U1F56_21680 [Rubrivivax sp.]